MVIYKITNLLNGKIYIGQTIGTLKSRKNGYKKEMHMAKVHGRTSRPIVNALNKYGMHNFEFTTVEDEVQSMEELNRLEEYYIKHTESLIEQGGYNIMLGGDNRRMSEDTKRKIGAQMVGELNWNYGIRGGDSHMSIPVIELTTGKEFPSSLEADEYFNISGSRDITTGDGASRGGYVFRKIIEGKIIQPNKVPGVTISIYEKVLPQYSKYVRKVNYNVSTRILPENNGFSAYHADKSVEILDITSGNVYPSTREAARELGISVGNISRNINGTLGMVNGHIFRKIINGVIFYEEDFKKPRQRIVDTVLDKYKEVI